MRKWSPRKIMVMAAAVCVIGSMTAVAAGKVTQISSHSSHANDFTYDKLGEMEAKLGFTTKAPETFSSGFCFSTGSRWSAAIWMRRQMWCRRGKR